MNTRFVPLTRELLDWAVIEHRDPVTAEIWATTPEYLNRALAVPSLCWAMIGRGHVLGAGGLVFHWHGRAEGWWLVSGSANRRDLVAATRFSRQFLDDRQRNPALRRIEMWVRADSTWCRGFARALGFELEGTARAFLHGEDHCYFARVKDV